MTIDLVDSGAALQSMRNSDFDCYSAYGEVLDNSVEAEAATIKMQIDYAPSSQHRNEPITKIAFGDDGIGMDVDILHRCLQLGYSSRYNDRKGIGRFGVGATLAAINQCKRIDIYSKEKGHDWLYTYIDLDEITAIPPSMKDIPAPQTAALPKEYSHLCGSDSGTLVLWSKYDRQAASASEIVPEARIWIGRTYRKFIWDGVSFSLNGEPVPAIDPLYVKTEGTRFADDPQAHEFTPMAIDWPIPLDDQVQGGPTASTIEIRMSLLPEKFRPTQGSGNSTEARDRYIDFNNGVSILRNGREVFYDVIPYWPGKRFEEIDRWWSCEISFEAVLDKEFTVKNIKRGAVPNRELKKTISDKIEPTRETALSRVREIWDQARARIRTVNEPGGLLTGHETAEKTAGATSLPKNIIDQHKNLEIEAEKISEEWLKHLNEQQRAAWKAKFANQPYTIVNAEWRSPEFFETSHLGGNDVLRLNMRHALFDELNAIEASLGDVTSDDSNAARLRTVLDLLLISYTKAEASFDRDTPFKAEALLEHLRFAWGNFLSSYLTTLQDADAN